MVLRAGFVVNNIAYQFSLDSLYCLLVLEHKPGEVLTFDHVHDMAKRLGELEEFRSCHYQLLHGIDEAYKGTLANEQKDLDHQNHVINNSNMHIKKLVIIIISSANSSKYKTTYHQQSQLEKAVNFFHDAVKFLPHQIIVSFKNMSSRNKPMKLI